MYLNQDGSLHPVTDDFRSSYEDAYNVRDRDKCYRQTSDTIFHRSTWRLEVIV
jgi:hypothetical protein